jgi:hypothetical protein
VSEDKIFERKGVGTQSSRDLIKAIAKGDDNIVAECRNDLKMKML